MSLPLLPALVALWAIVLFEGLVILGLLRAVRDLQVAVESGRLPQRLPVGARSPRFTGTDLRTGAEIDSSQLAGRELVVLFLSEACTFCRRLADGTRQVPFERGQARIAICQGGANEAATFIDLLASDVAVLADPDGAVFATFGISSTPSAIVVGETGAVLASGGPHHSGELAALISTARQSAVGADQPLPATAG